MSQMPDLILVEGGEVKIVDLEEPTHKLPNKGKKKKRRRITKKNVKKQKVSQPMEEVVDMTKEAVGFSFDLDNAFEAKALQEELEEKETVARHKKATTFLNAIKEDITKETKQQQNKQTHKSKSTPRKPCAVLSPQLHRVICTGTGRRK